MGEEIISQRLIPKDSKILARCMDIMLQLGVDPDTFCNRWEAWSSGKKGLKLNEDNLKKFLTDATKQSDKSNKIGLQTPTKSQNAQTSSTSSSPYVDRNQIKMQEDSMYVDGLPEISKKRSRFEGLERAKKDSKFSSRRDATKVEVLHVGSSSQRTIVPSNQVLDIATHPLFENKALREGYSWGHNATDAIANALHERLSSITSAIINRNNLEEPLTKITSQSPFISIGQIATGNSDKLNIQDIYLRPLDQQPIKLDLIELQSLSVFRGQCVAIRGINPQGRRLAVHELYSDAAPPADPSGVSDGFKCREMHAIVASGPYTSNDDLSYEPLVQLMNTVQTKKPRLLVLMGPFVDENHPSIKNGSSNKPFDILFSDILETVETSRLAMPYLDVVLIPSLHDVFHQNIFPQPGFSTDQYNEFSGSLLVPQQLRVASNPTMLRVNDLHMSFVSTDVIAMMEQNSLSFGQGNDDKSEVCVRMLLQQQSFMPIWPPPKGINIDIDQMSLLSIPTLPDVMFFASSIPVFVKVVNGVLAINVGHLVTGTQGGCYTEIKIGSIDSGESISVPDRTTVAITRI